MKKINLTTQITDAENEKIIRSINPKKRLTKRSHFNMYYVSGRELRNDDNDLHRINNDLKKRNNYIKKRR